ncbi:HRDC domain-containing protein [Paenibacillus turpanensis]|uniref:HRDC domain-containing protein n=1 Tax=Paenibacillus turpanensis TaxID=2689078 RepID=UPI00140C4096|nr:HRDC domain-containing protein [Paenibacillus turpanensis]
MNFVFLNSLERKTEEDRARSAQISICEEAGKWYVIWNEPGRADGEEQSVWYEGDCWEDMLACFRTGIREKMDFGFVPMIDTAAEPIVIMSDRARLVNAMEYYSERYVNEEGYAALRKWRNETAAKLKKTPYLIATNRVLKMIAVFLPQTEEELMQIPGLGARKVELYGQDILTMTNRENRESAFPVNWILDQIDEREFHSWMGRQQEQKLKDAENRGVIKAKLLEGMVNGATAAELAEALSLNVRQVTVWAEQLDEEGYDIDPFLVTELSAVPEEKREEAIAAFQTEGHRYLKPVYQKVYGESLGAKEMERAYDWLRLLRLRYKKQNSKDSTAVS